MALPQILHIETSSSVCSVAWSEGEEVVAFREDREKNAHARVITLLIDDLVKSNQRTLNQADAIAVSEGPGSYTGLRIGAAVAKGLCYALNKPLIAVSTLQSLSVGLMELSFEQTGCYFLPVIDARRMDIYAALYSSSGQEIIAPGFFTLNEAFCEKLKRYPKIMIGGDAAEKAKEVLTGHRFQFYESLSPHALLMAPLAHQKFLRNDFADVAYFEPKYVNESYAAVKK